jgi:hypothetical protein
MTQIHWWISKMDWVLEFMFICIKVSCNNDRKDKNWKEYEIKMASRIESSFYIKWFYYLWKKIVVFEIYINYNV